MPPQHVPGSPSTTGSSGVRGLARRPWFLLLVPGLLLSASKLLARDIAWTREALESFRDSLVEEPTHPGNREVRKELLTSLLAYTRQTAGDLPLARGLDAPTNSRGFLKSFEFDRFVSQEELKERFAARDLAAGIAVSWNLTSPRPATLFEARAPDELYLRAARALGLLVTRDQDSFRRRCFQLMCLDAGGQLDASWMAPARERLEQLIRRPHWQDEASPEELDAVLRVVGAAARADPSPPARPLPSFPAFLLLAGIVGGVGFVWRRHRRAAPREGASIQPDSTPDTSGSAAHEAKLKRDLEPPGDAKGERLRPEDLAGQLPERYSGATLLGQGGMGAVFLAQDSLLKRHVALKAYPFMDPDPDHPSVQRFLREAQVLASLDHPRILRVFDVAVEPFPYFTMELLEGCSLDEYCEDRLPLEIGEALPLTLGALEGLGYAHAQGVIHRDLKPANIQRLPDGQVKLLDFGLALHQEITARLTQSGAIAGTPAYLSPEQLQDADASPRTDVYALGVVLYWLLTGRFPIDSNQVFAKIYNPPRPAREHRPDLPASLDEALLRALSPDPESRFQSAEDFSTALRALAPTRL